MTEASGLLGRSTKNPVETLSAMESAPRIIKSLWIPEALHWQVRAAAGWHNAGEFGNRDLKNNDVNNAFNASLGLRSPMSFSDLFNGMDVFPEDTIGRAGGDGQIRFLIGKSFLSRSLRLDSDNWKARGRQEEFVSLQPLALNGSANQPADSQVQSPGDIWSRPALIGAMPIEKVNPDSVVDVDLCEGRTRSRSVSGLRFRSSCYPVMKLLPEIQQQAVFVPAPGIKVLDPLMVCLQIRSPVLECRRVRSTATGQQCGGSHPFPYACQCSLRCLLLHKFCQR